VVKNESGYGGVGGGGLGDFVKDAAAGYGKEWHCGIWACFGL